MASEKVFEKKVKAFLREQGAYYLKTWSNGVQRRGVPDLLCCINGYFVGAELKADDGEPSELQLKNVEWIRKAGGFAMVLYPSAFERFKQFVLDLKQNKSVSESELIWR